MFGSVVIDVGIGLVFIYLLLALLCMVAHEWIAGLLNLRAKTLDAGVQNLLGGELAQEFYRQPLIRSLSPPEGKPSYVPASAFAQAIVDLPIARRRVADSADAFKQSLDSLKNATGHLPDHVRLKLLALWDRPTPAGEGVDEKVEEAKRDLEEWFDQGMERVSGWYKRRTQLRILILAGVVTILANADTIRVANHLWENPTLRARMVEEAKVRAAKPAPLLSAEYPEPDDPIPSPAPTVDVESQYQERQREAARLSEEERGLLGELTGWSFEFRALRWLREGRVVSQTVEPPTERRVTVGDLWKVAPSHVASFSDAAPVADLFSSAGLLWLFAWILPKHLLGWFVTATAVSLGAPFWFDMLQTLLKMGVRSSGERPGGEARDAGR